MLGCSKAGQGVRAQLAAANAPLAPLPAATRAGAAHSASAVLGGAACAAQSKGGAAGTHCRAGRMARCERARPLQPVPQGPIKFHDFVGDSWVVLFRCGSLLPASTL